MIGVALLESSSLIFVLTAVFSTADKIKITISNTAHKLAIAINKGLLYIDALALTAVSAAKALRVPNITKLIERYNFVLMLLVFLFI
jgi:hypothetical protein